MAKDKKNTAKSTPEPIETEESLTNSPENTESPEGAVDDTAPEGEPGNETEGTPEGESEESTEKDEEPENEHSGKVLKATRLILYRGQLYDAGDELPADDQHDVAEWLKFGSAAWLPEKSEKALSARPAGAVTGRGGLAAGGEKDIDGNDLVGKVPKTAQRSK